MTIKKEEKSKLRVRIAEEINEVMEPIRLEEGVTLEDVIFSMWLCSVQWVNDAMLEQDVEVAHGTSGTDEKELAK